MCKDSTSGPGHAPGTGDLSGAAPSIELSAILESLREAVVVVNSSGAPIRANLAYDRLHLGTDGALTFLDGDGSPLDPAATPHQRAARSETADLELMLVDSEGGQHPYQVTIRPIRPPGPTGSVGVITFNDLTDRQLRLREEELMGLLGHELRTPLSSLCGYAQLLTDYLHDDLSSSMAQAAVERIRSLSERLGLMIEDLIELARASSGKLRIAQDVVDLDAVVRSAVEIAATLPNAPPISVETTGEPITLHGDSRRLGGVVLNLLTNAIKHAAGTDRIEVRVRMSATEATLQVEDYGPGIPPDALPFIFSRHYQVRRRGDDAHGARGARPDGLGLGLYIVQQIVDAHGGRIDVTSQVGVGTCFTIQLPRAPVGEERRSGS